MNDRNSPANKTTTRTTVKDLERRIDQLKGVVEEQVKELEDLEDHVQTLIRELGMRIQKLEERNGS